MRRGLSLAFYANGLAMVRFFTAVMVPRWRVARQGMAGMALVCGIVLLMKK